jgi:hypothetical protein
LQQPAGAAHLAAREPAVDLDHGLSVHRRFYLYGLDRVSDTGVAQAAGKVVVFNHAAQVEVLHWIMLEASGNTSSARKSARPSKRMRFAPGKRTTKPDCI